MAARLGRSLRPLESVLLKARWGGASRLRHRLELLGDVRRREPMRAAKDSIEVGFGGLRSELPLTSDPQSALVAQATGNFGRVDEAIDRAVLDLTGGGADSVGLSVALGYGKMGPEQRADWLLTTAASLRASGASGVSPVVQELAPVVGQEKSRAWVHAYGIRRTDSSSSVRGPSERAPGGTIFWVDIGGGSPTARSVASPSPSVLTCVACGQDGMASALVAVVLHAGVGVRIEWATLPPSLSTALMNNASVAGHLVGVGMGDDEAMKRVWAHRGWEAVRIGSLVEERRIGVEADPEWMADLPLAVFEGANPWGKEESVVPTYLLRASGWSPERNKVAEPGSSELRQALPKLLAHPSIAFRPWFDAARERLTASHGAKTRADGWVRIPNGSGRPQRTLVIVHGTGGRFAYLHPRAGAARAVASRVLALVCAGARPCGATLHVATMPPHGAESRFLVDETLAGLAEAAAAFSLPVLEAAIDWSGEGSVENNAAVPIVSVVGELSEAAEAISPYAEEPGSSLILLGGSAGELAGSLYQQEILKVVAGMIEEPAYDRLRALHGLMLNVIEARQVRGARAIGIGGLATAVARMLFVPALGEGTTEPPSRGARLMVSPRSIFRRDTFLFGEDEGRVLLAVAPADEAPVLAKAAEAGVAAQVIGEVTDGIALAVQIGGLAIAWRVDNLRTLWDSALADAVAPFVPKPAGPAGKELSDHE